MWVVVTVVAVVVLAATYLTWTAARVDRLQARVSAAFSALDAHLVRRAAAAVELAERRPAEGGQPGPAERGPGLAVVARAALSAHPDDREAVENDLTRSLRELVGPAGQDDHDDPLATVVAASRRVALARQVHNDLVRDTLALRHRWLVRTLRIGRQHPEPRYFDIDDPILSSR